MKKNMTDTFLNEQVQQLMLSSHENAFLSNMNEGILMIDYRLKVILVNESGARHWKSTSTDLFGKALTDLIPGFDFSEFYKRLFDCMTTQEKSIIAELRLFTCEETYYTVKLIPTSAGILILTQDDTERKRTEKLWKQYSNQVDALFYKNIQSNSAYKVKLKNIRTILKSKQPTYEEIKMVSESMNDLIEELIDNSENLFDSMIALKKHFKRKKESHAHSNQGQKSN